jgi:hypothetical protein
MRFLVIAVIFTLSLTCAYTPALRLDDSSIALATLQAKADQAQPRDRCFLYAELVSQMTDLAGQQFNSGHSDEASETLNLVRLAADEIHLNIADDGRKLRNAEVLMQHTIFRLKNILNASPYEDRPALEATLKKLDQVQGQLMMQVFKK